ncbi:MAG: hypothetical protein JWQ12_250 [Glaciihabitans sp.]|nr:hypothetical protein [Glaciihabitans sp.]
MSTTANIPTTEYAYAVVRRGGELLVIRRQGDGAPIPQFHLPGGRVDFGEHAEAEARRFVLEQTGIDVTNLSLLARGDEVMKSLGTSSDRVTWFFECELTDPPALTGDAEWQPLEAFRDDDALLFPDEALALIDSRTGETKE